MKTIYMVCRTEKEKPNALIQMVQTLFPECEIRILSDSGSDSASCSQVSPSVSSSVEMEGI